MSVDYTGYDLVPEMVARALKRYPQGRFEVRDALQGFGDERFDYIVSSGAFNIDFGDNLEAVQGLLRVMFDACTQGVAMNMLSIADPQPDPFFYHYDPQVMQAFCQTFCPRVVIREDYLPNDFTLYLYRQVPEGEKKGFVIRAVALYFSRAVLRRTEGVGGGDEGWRTTEEIRHLYGFIDLCFRCPGSAGAIGNVGHAVRV